MTTILLETESVARSLSATRRYVGIDAGRVVMAFLVVVLHSLGNNDDLGSTMIGMVCRCAVPFFLIATGYFLKVPGRFTTALVARPITRLLPIYIFWMVVNYAVAYLTQTSALKLGIRDLVSGGTAYHLWYLPAVGAAMVLVPAGVLLLGSRVTGLGCAALAAAAIALGTYHDVLHLPGSPARGGLLVAPFFIFIGHQIARLKLTPSLPIAAALAIAGFTILMSEEVWISFRLGVPLADHDFAIGTIAYGAGVFLLARALTASSGVGRLSPLGLSALGIYVSHLLFLWCLEVAFGKATLTDALWRAPLAFACALLLTTALRETPYLKRTVA